MGKRHFKANYNNMAVAKYTKQQGRRAKKEAKRATRQAAYELRQTRLEQEKADWILGEGIDKIPYRLRSFYHDTEAKMSGKSAILITLIFASAVAGGYLLWDGMETDGSNENLPDCSDIPPGDYGPDMSSPLEEPGPGSYSAPACKEPEPTAWQSAAAWPYWGPLGAVLFGAPTAAGTYKGVRAAQRSRQERFERTIKNVGRMRWEMEYNGKAESRPKKAVKRKKSRPSKVGKKK